MSSIKFKHYHTWRIVALLLILLQGVNCKKNKVNVIARFTYTRNCNASATCEVRFVNQSQNADSYQWDFGDGSVSVEVNPVHKFSQTREFYLVKLKAISISGPTEIVAQDTVFLYESALCQSIGSFKCASKLETGITVKDKISPERNNNYYFFIMPSAGVARIELKPVPAGSAFYVNVLSEARDNSPVIKSMYGYPGETISFFAGPLAKDSFFIRVNPPSNAGSELYNITYTFIGDDANEVNNNFAQSTALTLNTAKSGSILAEGDLDYFSFHLSKPRVVDISVSPVPAFPGNGYLTMETYGSANSNSMLHSEYGYAGETIKLSEGPLDTGWYYIKLRANSKESTDKYNILVTPDDKDPNEMNNIFSTATLIQANQQIPATIKANGDVDFYKFVAGSNSPGMISIDKVPAGLSYMYVDVFNAANNSSRTDSKYATEGNSLNFNTAQPFVAGNTYYIKVYSYYSTQQSNEQYKLKVSQ